MVDGTLLFAAAGLGSTGSGFVVEATTGAELEGALETTGALGATATSAATTRTVWVEGPLHDRVRLVSFADDHERARRLGERLAVEIELQRGHAELGLALEHAGPRGDRLEDEGEVPALLRGARRDGGGRVGLAREVGGQRGDRERERDEADVEGGA